MHRRADHGLGHRPLTVAGLWRYPVKSMVGEQVSRIDIDMSGVVGDRGYAVADAVTGKMLTAKREPRLLSAMANWREREVTITLPAGTVVAAGDPAAGSVLSDWLGRPVRLVSGGSPFVDDAPVHLLSGAAIPSAGNVRRFRPNVLVESHHDDVCAEPESRWLDRPCGLVLDIGTARLTAIEACVRCVMVTHAQPGLPADPRVLRTLKRDRTLGVYAKTKAPGVISLGDQVRELFAATTGALP